MLRVWVFGHSNDIVFPPPVGQIPESMPFKKNANGKYIVKATSTTAPTLHPRYINRLKQVLTEADNNGQTILLSLFDHYGFRTTQRYQVSAWDPDNNDLGNNCQLPNDFNLNGGAAFYNICNTTANGNVCTSLNCLGLAQRNLVNRIMTVLKTGNTNKTKFKNVIIELANESEQVSGVDLNSFKTWHKTVATWVKAHGKYLVSVNPGPNHEIANRTHKYMLDCSPTSCNNQYSVVNYSKVDLHSIHGGGWGDYPTLGSLVPCGIAQQAQIIFNKPVIIDDDGGATASGRNNSSTVFNWANAATQAGCRQGIVHYDHLDEGNRQPNPAPTCSPTTETANIDCATYNRQGDVSPFSDLCSVASSTCPGLTGQQYCVARGCYNP